MKDTRGQNGMRIASKLRGGALIENHNQGACGSRRKCGPAASSRITISGRRSGFAAACARSTTAAVEIHRHQKRTPNVIGM